MTLPSTEGHTANRPISLEVRRTLGLAGPVIAAQIGMMAMGVTDTILVGPLGAAALAAVSVGSGIFFAVLVLFNGTVMALEPLVSQAFGAGEREKVGDHLWQGLWLAILFGLPLTFVFVDSEWIFHLLGQPPMVAKLAGEYLRGRALAVMPFLLFQAFRSMLNGIGKPRSVMVVTIVANVLNVPLDWALIYGHLGMPRLGVMGAGLATSGVRVFMIAAMLWIVTRPSMRGFRLHPRWPSRRRLLRLSWIGFPIGGQQFAEVAVFATASVMAGWLGTAAQAAHMIAMTLASTTFMVPLGLSMAATVRVGYEVGRGSVGGAAVAGRVAMALGAGFMALSALAFIFVPKPFALAFSPGPEVLSVSIGLIGIAGVFQIFDGLQITSAGCLRGAGDTRTPLYATVLSHWLVGLPLGYVLAFVLKLGVYGLWWGLTGGLVLVAVSQSALFLRGGWRRLGRL